MAQSAADQARYLQEALAIARSRKPAPSPEEFLHVYALANQLDDVLNALIWLENDVSEMPTHLYEQWGGASSLPHARKVIAAAGAWTEAEEIQANLMREREAELGPDLPSRDEQEADEIASELGPEVEDETSEAAIERYALARENEATEREADEIASEFTDVPVSQGPHGVFSVETDEDLPRSPTSPTQDAHRGDTP